MLSVARGTSAMLLIIQFERAPTNYTFNSGRFC